MDPPRIVWRDGQPVLLDLFDLPHSAADLRAVIAKLEAQLALIEGSRTAVESALDMRRAWLQELEARDVSHVA